ncbi:hypothetical protein GN956_G12611 [Arapaima gigas]
MPNVSCNEWGHNRDVTKEKDSSINPALAGECEQLLIPGQRSVLLLHRQVLLRQRGKGAARKSQFSSFPPPVRSLVPCPRFQGQFSNGAGEEEASKLKSDR